MGSSRLPKKVMKDIAGLSALKWIVRAAQYAKLVDDVVVATPDMEICNYCNERDINFAAGPEEDVLGRFQIAANLFRADRIVRLTADCPFVDPHVIDECVQKNCSAVKYWPDGMDIQVFDAAWLPLGDKEHVVPVNNCLPQLYCPAGNMRHVRITLDTPQDLSRLRDIAEHLPKDRPPLWQETLAAYSLKMAA